jgi:hypothetical protein
VPDSATRAIVYGCRRYVVRPSTPLNLPQPLHLQARATHDGPVPRAVHWRGRWRQVVAVDDWWLVDDEWWRDHISRCSFVVRLEGDVPFTCFYDRVARSWWWQRA